MELTYESPKQNLNRVGFFCIKTKLNYIKIGYMGIMEVIHRFNIESLNIVYLPIPPRIKK